MSEVKSPDSLRGYEAIVMDHPSQKGLVLSDEYSEHLVSSILTIDWNEEPPEIVMIDHEEMIAMENGYLFLNSAGRGLGFIPVPLVHLCGDVCVHGA